MQTKVRATVDAYLLDFPEDVRESLEKIRRAIKDTAPEAEELISYGIPGYKLNGVLIYFAGFKNHISMYPATEGLMRKMGKELTPFKKGAGTLQFPLDKPPSASLVKKIVKVRIQENEQRKEQKYGKK